MQPFRIGIAFAWQSAMTVTLILTLLVILPATAALLFETSIRQRSLLKPGYTVGTPLVYRQQEVSTRPAANAREIRPAERGDFYYYSIINYLRVVEVLRDGRIIAVTRNEARLCFWPNESNLRKARLRERLIYPPRFPHS
jgi:hypothetical protein